MTVHITVALDEGQMAQLEALAEQSRVPSADLAARALANFIADEAAHIAAVEAGLADIRAGKVHDYDDVARDLRAYVSERMKQARG